MDDALAARLERALDRLEAFLDEHEAAPKRKPREKAVEEPRPVLVRRMAPCVRCGEHRPVTYLGTEGLCPPCQVQQRPAPEPTATVFFGRTKGEAP